jgi:hypothetical protein
VNKKATDTRESISIELPNKVVVLKLTTFDTDIDTDALTQIQYHNIMGEILTSSTALNRVGNLQAEIDNLVNAAKLDFEIFYAQQSAKKRKELTFEEPGPKGVVKVNKPTVAEVEEAVITCPEYKVMKQRQINLVKSKAYVDSLYWSLKDKCDKVNKLTDKLRPEEFEKELLEDTINGVMITLKPKAIKG